MTSGLFSPERCGRLVIKVGSSLLVNGDGTIKEAWLRHLIASIARRREQGQHIMVVSSGAIALGARRLGLPKGGRASLEDSQAAAAVGQIVLARAWAEGLAVHDIQAAQLLLTLDDLEDRKRYLNAAAAMNRLLDAGAVPILNENDTVATEEIRFGDNDRLAARVGQAALADGVILLSDVDGLFTANPKANPDAVLIPTITEITSELESMAGHASTMGSGGMISKLQAARIAVHAGCHMAIINGTVDDPLQRFDQSGRGTIFTAHHSPPTARKTWLAGRLTVAGRVMIDEGAIRALREGGSLLPAGVQYVEGAFERGDVIDVCNLQNIQVARGVSSYNAQDARRIAGLKLSEIESILHHAPCTAMIHRDDLVML